MIELGVERRPARGRVRVDDVPQDLRRREERVQLALARERLRQVDHTSCHGHLTERRLAGRRARLVGLVVVRRQLRAGEIWESSVRTPCSRSPAPGAPRLAPACLVSCGFVMRPRYPLPRAHPGASGCAPPVRHGARATRARARRRALPAPGRGAGSEFSCHRNGGEQRQSVDDAWITTADRPQGPRRHAAGDVVRLVDADAAQAEQLGVARIGERGQRLAGLVARLTLVSRCSQRDLGQVAVAQDADDEARILPVLPQARGGDQLGDAVHLHRSVPGKRHERPLRVRELRRDAIREGAAHRGQRARKGGRARRAGGGGAGRTSRRPSRRPGSPEHPPAGGRRARGRGPRG